VRSKKKNLISQCPGVFTIQSLYRDTKSVQRYKVCTEDTFESVYNVFVENVTAEEPVPNLASSHCVMRVQRFGNGLKVKKERIQKRQSHVLPGHGPGTSCDHATMRPTTGDCERNQFWVFHSGQAQFPSNLNFADQLLQGKSHRLAQMSPHFLVIATKFIFAPQSPCFVCPPASFQLKLRNITKKFVGEVRRKIGVPHERHKRVCTAVQKFVRVDNQHPIPFAID
jgi:hypothetical protein